ncbi:hypothetical protein KIL84_003347 [Mauremys mutica]|uniref:Uncharacterized protein n=1 Tax=Mauremys mutica TaxID=74926 RepID=A0A9D4ARC9_9SAUR|nr:hypothetical protein KIL84_003347 [Mauremys mutica]
MQGLPKSTKEGHTSQSPPLPSLQAWGGRSGGPVPISMPCMISSNEPSRSLCHGNALSRLHILAWNASARSRGLAPVLQAGSCNLCPLHTPPPPSLLESCGEHVANMPHPCR